MLAGKRTMPVLEPPVVVVGADVPLEVVEGLELLLLEPAEEADDWRPKLPPIANTPGA